MRHSKRNEQYVFTFCFTLYQVAVAELTKSPGPYRGSVGSSHPLSFLQNLGTMSTFKVDIGTVLKGDTESVKKVTHVVLNVVDIGTQL